MQKMIGSVMIIVACTAMGFQKGRELQMHLKELEELKKIFTLIQSELQYTRAPFTEIFLKISKKTERMHQKWLSHLAKELEKCEGGTLQDVWQVSICECLQESKLTKEELEDLKQVGKNLGYMETLDLYQEQLELSIQKTREELKNKKKLYQSMGIMTGIFLVIVLL